MPTSYLKKAYFCGNILEQYEYSKPVFRGLTVAPPRGTRGIMAPKSEKRADSSVFRTRRNLRRLVNSNPNLSSFITLTFAENLTDISLANLYFKLFIQKLKRRYPTLLYIAVIEFQKRGAVHYHLLAKLPYIPQNELSDLWGHGFVGINKLTNLKNVGAYIAKYIQKGAFSARLVARKAYFCSRALLRAVEVLDDLIYFRSILCYSGVKEKLCSFTFTSPQFGQVLFSSFRL